MSLYMMQFIQNNRFVFRLILNAKRNERGTAVRPNFTESFARSICNGHLSYPWGRRWREGEESDSELGKTVKQNG